MRLPIEIDVHRTDLQRRFFARYAGGGTPDEVFAAVAAERMDTATLIASDDCARLGYAGWTYWLLYLRGFLESRERGGLAPDNVYARYLIDHYLPGPHDPGLVRQLPDETSALARVGARFADLHSLLGPRRAGAAAGIRPVRVLGSNRRRDDLHDIFDAPSGVSVKARAVDGWHRLFAARLGDVGTLRGVVRLDETTWTSTP